MPYPDHRQVLTVATHAVKWGTGPPLSGVVFFDKMSPLICTLLWTVLLVPSTQNPVPATDTAVPPATEEAAEAPDKAPAKPPTPQHTGSRSILRGLKGDIRHLPSTDNLLIGAIGGGLALGMDLLRAQAVTGMLVEPIKFATHRERPGGSNRQSFPSGHAAVTFATATVIERHLGWKKSVLAYAIASYVSASRLHDNRHYLSDVISEPQSGPSLAAR